MFTHTETRVAVINPGTIAGLIAFVATGALLVIRPVAVFGFVAILVTFVLLIFVTRRLTGLELWQAMVITALTGYIVLGYGFANLAFHIGIPIIVGHGLMFAALGLALFSHRPLFIKALREPAVRYLLALIPLTLLRLVFDVPRYGIWAVRDASMFLEGVFLLLGFILAMEKHCVNSFVKWLMAIFVLNLIYSCLYPWAESISDWSPKSGVFLEVPVFGNYGGNVDYLLAGALFCILVARHAVGWPRWILSPMAAVQLSGLAIFQSRAMYLGLLVCLLVLVVVGEIRKWAELTALISLGLVALLFVTSFLGLELSGRVGPVKLDFIKEHASGLVGNQDAPAAGSLSGRLDWYDEVFRRVTSSTTALLVGDGFGKPLIDFSIPSGVIVRQPHNSHLTVLARLGALGMFMWILFHFSIARRFVYAFRHRRYFEPKLYALVLWLFFYYILLSLDSSVEAGLEFSFGAIPYYVLIGFALGVIRSQKGRLVDPNHNQAGPTLP